MIEARFQTRTGLVYTLEVGEGAARPGGGTEEPELSTAIWRDLTTVAGSGDEAQVLTPFPTDAVRRFYRVRVELPP